MIAESRLSGILCSGANAAQAVWVCGQAGCNSYGMACGDRKCGCMAPHRGHQMFMIDGLDATLSAPPLLSEDGVALEKSINAVIDDCIAELQRLKRSHSDHVTAHAESRHRHTVLKRKLLRREPMELR